MGMDEKRVRAMGIGRQYANQQIGIERERNRERKIDNYFLISCNLGYIII
jgi:hypothetical protein